MAEADSPHPSTSRDGWRRLGLFWVSVLALMALGGGVVQWLGPPAPARAAIASADARPSPKVARPPDNPVPALVKATPIPVAQVMTGRDSPGPIADPDPGLSAPVGEGSTESLPRIAADGRKPMQVYAAGFDHSSRRPRVGLLLAGIGLNEAESDAAMRALPASVSLAISPHAANPAKLLATARALGHEYLVALPLEPVGFPLNDPGPHTLLTSASQSANLRNLYWALSRFDGYVGATGVIATMRGERLAAMTDQMEAMLADLSERGLLYVDPREGHGPVAKAWGRRADLVIDDPLGQDVTDRAEIDARLAALEQQAKDAGSALGLIMRPTPVAVARIAAWCTGLVDRGLALAPVSALALPPMTEAPVKMTERAP